MPTNYQMSLPLIQHNVGQSVVPQRASDGYINATEMCKAANKKFAHYRELDSTEEFLQALSSKIGIPIDKGNQRLIESKPGAPSTGGGSWVHPKAAIHLAQWLSADFAVMVTEWVYDWMSGKLKPKTELPPHLKRHLMNVSKIPVTHFSVLQEMTNMLVAPMEAQGYSLPTNLMPDISQGRLFCKHLRDKHGIDTNNFCTYTHDFPDGRKVTAKLYPLDLLGIFRQLMVQEWLPKAESYFKKRDANALPALQQLMQITYNPPSNGGTYKIKA